VICIVDPDGGTAFFVHSNFQHKKTARRLPVEVVIQIILLYSFYELIPAPVLNRKTRVAMRACMLFMIHLALSALSSAWKDCGDGSFCPDGNTCCSFSIGTTRQSVCITGHATNDDENNTTDTSGACCNDTFESTGCGADYQCADGNFCALRADAKDPTTKPDRLPRYKLCSVPNKVLQTPHAFAIEPHQPRLLYLSTKGSLDVAIQQHAQVETLLIMIHGSGRNVDDYICTTTAALPDNNASSSSSVMVVTPWFLAPEDHYNATNGTVPLVWTDDGPIWHTWRYGADAANANISSYATIDAIIHHVAANKLQFPKLRRIVVAGHSAGGQFVQRWALLSTAMDNYPNVNVRVVVANPKSFCYLDNRRHINNVFHVPGQIEIGNCTTYNEWEWGLADGNYLPTPYKDRAIQAAGGANAIVARYATRNVVYIAGELDVLLNGDCEANMQGPYRRKRSENFFDSLKQVYGHQVHRRLVVAGINHDHALMFQSPEGRQALFGTFGETDEQNTDTE
jgi:pimeloyl-ACP methyl ester carboxylesterase